MSIVDYIFYYIEIFKELGDVSGGERTPCRAGDAGRPPV